MKTQYWLPTVVFLGLSIPLVLLLNVLEVGGEYRIWLALGAGALATAFSQSRLKTRGEEE